MLLYLYTALFSFYRPIKPANGHEHPATLKDNQYQLCLPSEKKIYNGKGFTTHDIE